MSPPAPFSPSSFSTKVSFSSDRLGTRLGKLGRAVKEKKATVAAEAKRAGPSAAEAKQLELQAYLRAPYNDMHNDDASRGFGGPPAEPAALSEIARPRPETRASRDAPVLGQPQPRSHACILGRGGAVRDASATI